MVEVEERKIIFFEKITPGNYPLVLDHIFKGHSIYYFSADSKLNLGMKNNLFSFTFDYNLIITAGAVAHKNIDIIFDKYFSKSASIAITKNLYRSEELVNMYKKEILLYLNDLYYMELKINAIIDGREGEVEFYPADGFKIHTDETSLLSDRVDVIYNTTIYNGFADLYKQIRNCALLFYPLYILLKKVKWVSFNKKPLRKYQVGITTNLPSIFSLNSRYIDYLIKPGSGIPNDKIIFIDERYNKEIPEEFKERNINYIDFLHRKVTISLNLLIDFKWNFFPAWCICTIHSIWEDPHIVKTTRIILTDYIRWNILMDNIELKNNVTILLPDTISKNHILTQHGCKTWFIYPDNTTGDYSIGWDEKIPVSTVFTFMSVNSAVIHGNKVRRYFENHRNNIQNYVTVGVIPAQKVREIREGTAQSPLTNLIKRLPRIRIGVFDTTVADYGAIKIKDGIKFCKDILALLNDFPEVGVIFKEKKFRNFTPEVSSMYKLLEQHPRCVVIQQTGAGDISASDVIAASDLVISAAYTSTTTEAMGARTKAIYYDVVGKDIGDNFYFNQFPNFVAHDYQQLKELVNYWLYQVTPEEFESYLITYFKDEFDPYLDGRATERLTKLLTKSNGVCI